MMKGLFRKDRLLAVIKDFIYFPDSSDKELKIVCRYPQFLLQRNCLRISSCICVLTAMERAAHILALPAAARAILCFLTSYADEKQTFPQPDYFIIITDRTDLDDQLSRQFVGSKKYIGDETVVSIESREKLREELQGRESGGVYLTTIQKFTEDLQLLTDRTNVICISDEAHRSQINLDQKVKVTEAGVERKYGFAKVSA